MVEAARDRLVGTWELVEYSITSDAGRVHRPLGPNTTGLIMYTADGHMSAQLMNPDRAPFAGPDVHAGTSDELAAAAGGYLAYSGRYRLEDDGLTVHHLVAASLFPNWVGTDRVRRIRLRTERNLALGAEPFRRNGVVWDPAVVWRRAAAH
ncbi:hypothetical protein nbrc107696_04610 [Gordonia spumicola]|uniref:Lipocalin-like domain-containing protein n=2 Tax=Gordonia spumicola TaxID=589161 RepID=A0A7I9V3L6_9ACTN|nr:hypothetical protein nbrc107696_04610 [Gordonia spumicola]